MLYHRPVCSPCEVEMRPFKNGVVVVDYAERGPYQLWEADEWACPKCKHKIVVGFGAGPVAREGSGEDLSLIVRRAAEAGLARHNREFNKE